MGSFQSEMCDKKCVVPMNSLVKTDLFLAENDDFYIEIREKGATYSYAGIAVSQDGVQGSHAEITD